MSRTRLPSQLLRSLSRPALHFGSFSIPRFPIGARSSATQSRATLVDRSATSAPPRFADFDLHPDLLARIKHPSCSEIQALTLPAALGGQDILAQAKTGTGKTAAFLIPTLDALLRPSRHRQRGQVSCLIVSPTRELANQIAAEATTLAPAGTSIVCVYGATPVKNDLRKLAGGCDILVGTPGRLNDLITNYDLADRLRGIRHLILDEGDRLLDSGFKPEVEKIVKALPRRADHPRQTLLFSATVPSSLKSVVSLALLPGYVHLSSIKAGEDNTHMHVPQQATVVDWSDIYAASLGIISEEMQRNPDSYKIIVFCPTARGTAVFYEAVAAVREVGPIYQIQSRMSQSKRETASAAFRACQKGILFSSDVSARGLDYPSISLVVQVGVPANPEDYIHRVGRTGRGGKGGRGALILTPDEHSSFMQKPAMKGLPIKDAPAFDNLKEFSDLMMTAMANVDVQTRDRAAAAQMGFIKGLIKDKARVVALSKEYAVGALGLPKFPPLEKQIIGKMGMKGMGLEEIAPSAGSPSGRRRI